MVYILAITLEICIYFLFCEMQCICPVDLPTFEEGDGLVTAIIHLLKHAVVQARVHHQHQIAQIQRMSYRVLIQQYLFIEFT